jgi:hypothetical protein
MRDVAMIARLIEESLAELVAAVEPASVVTAGVPRRAGGLRAAPIRPTTSRGLNGGGARRSGPPPPADGSDRS